jgi:hypothetical protein
VIDGVAQLTKTGRRRLSGRYLAALRVHLRDGSGRDGVLAREVGQAALTGGLETLDLAVMHERAVITLASAHDFADLRNGALNLPRTPRGWACLG